MPTVTTTIQLMMIASCSLVASVNAAVSADMFVEPLTPGMGDGFGASVAIGDSYYVAGAPTDDDVASDAGSVTIYICDSSGVPVTTILEAPSGLNIGAHFGNIVAADGDTFVVSAPAKHNSTLAPVGAIYVYTVGISTITLQAVLQPSTIIPSDLFGQDVDIIGDTVVVGAPGSAGGEGSVFVYTRTMGDWSTGSEVFGPHGDDGDGFGWAVALDHDNEERMIVGAPWDDDAGPNAGRVHVYEYLMSTWSPLSEIDQADIGSATSRLGIKVDFDGDHFAVGEPLNGNGFIHIIGWDGSSSSWGLVETLQPTTSASYSLFGESLSLDGELLAVGVRMSDLNGTMSGAGYLFRLIASSDWEQLVELEGDTNGVGYTLGQGVCVNQDILAMGSPGATTITTTTIQGGLVFGWDVSSTPGCPADIEMTGVVDADDLAALLLAWGTCTDPMGCPEDLDDDNEIGVLDLLLLLADWGGC